MDEYNQLINDPDNPFHFNKVDPQIAHKNHQRKLKEYECADYNK